METNALKGYEQSPIKLYTDAYLLFSEARLDQLTNLSSTIAVAAIGAVAFLVFALLPAISGIAKLSLYANYRMGLRPLPFTGLYWVSYSGPSCRYMGADALLGERRVSGKCAAGFACKAVDCRKMSRD